ncbi:acylphosphatase [Aquimarina sediminis]|uniref:acylphosphatase n=1 Tax=Aquimarina sediminis TaxID=2070536 RepID=UPI000CA05D70|nr:acylphosphatase [Aquimarina sediminis]
MQKHYNITITGKVQGVWYRKTTKEKAEELEIKGTVRNLSNGNVYIEAEGHIDQLDSLLKWCSRGPEFALVNNVSFEEGDLQQFKSFEIVK